MQRIRISLPYYKAIGWEPVVICVDEKYVGGFTDELLSETIPKDIEVHKVKAWPLKITRKLGLGSLSIRSFLFFKKKGTELLNKKKFDLVFFSTSSFHVCALGRYWKEKFGVPFLIDMQDPWRPDFYLDKPKSHRPPKFWLNYEVHKKLEAYTMPHAGGIISVSQAYIDILKLRYEELRNKPSLLLPFGISQKDFDFVTKKRVLPEIINLNNGKINVVYVGAVNKFFLPLIHAFFAAFVQSVTKKEQYHFYFIGTSYSVGNKDKMIEQIAKQLNIGELVTEVTNRIPYFSALSTLLHSDIIFIPGSIDQNYNASKVFNNIFTRKPIFAILNENSPTRKAIEEAKAGFVVSVSSDDEFSTLVKKIKEGMPKLLELRSKGCETDIEALGGYAAKEMVERQANFFNLIVGYELGETKVLQTAFI
jgi:hypothetical protein